MKDPLRMHQAFKTIQHVVIPYELSTGRREGTRVGPHLSLQRQGCVIRVAKVEVAGEINILEDFQVPIQHGVSRTLQGSVRGETHYRGWLEGRGDTL